VAYTTILDLRLHQLLLLVVLPWSMVTIAVFAASLLLGMILTIDFNIYLQVFSSCTICIDSFVDSISSEFFNHQVGFVLLRTPV
jgi:hypothetical protein